MRIAYLCKRHYMGKDVVLDRYARLFEIPFQLARLGHMVEGHCLSYRRGKSDTGHWSHDASPGTLNWHSHSLGHFVAPQLLRYPHQLLKQLQAFAPDLIIGASDIPHVALAAWIAKQMQRPLVADLYDNFEGFGQARIPGMVTALRRAVRSADLVLTTSEPLRELIVNGYQVHAEVISMPSTVDKSVFRSRDAMACRAALGLPVDALLVGTAGGLYRDKGIGALYASWALLSEALPDVHLVLAGPREADMPMPTGPRVHYLGAMAHERVAELFCALDVGAICIQDTPFGRYCFPQKAYEMLACRLPVVAADVGAMGRLFEQEPQCLYRAGDSSDLAQKLRAQLTNQLLPQVEIDDWREIISKLEPRLFQLLDPVD